MRQRSRVMLTSGSNLSWYWNPAAQESEFDR